MYFVNILSNLFLYASYLGSRSSKLIKIINQLYFNIQWNPAGILELEFDLFFF